MPSEVLSFRTMCGQFLYIFQHFMSKRLEMKNAMSKVTLKVRTYSDGATVGFLLAILCFGNLILLSGDIEENPGPPKNSRQTRLTSVGQTAKTNIDNIQSETPPTSQSTSSQPTLRDIMNLLCSMNSSLDQVWQPSETRETNEPTTMAASRDVPIAEESSATDLTSLLHEMNRKFDGLKSNLKDLTKMCTKIQSDMSDLKKEMNTLKNDHENLQKENGILKDQIEALEQKTDHHEFHCKRNNLIFHGVFRKDNETSVECEKTVSKLLRDKLELNQDIEFDKIQRVNKKSDSPVVVSFTFHQQRELVFKLRHKLQGTNIFISPDLPVRIRGIRKKLLPFLKEAKKAGKKAFLVYDHVIVDGKKYYLDHEDVKLCS